MARQGVSIITPTNRPHFFMHILQNYKRQQYPLKELIIVLNKDSMKLSDYRHRVKAYKNVSVYQVAEKYSLGRCLNYAVRQAKYPNIAKFDDDDYYSPYYIAEQIQAINHSGASIVGKWAHMIYVEEKKLLILRFPSQKNRFVKNVAGGSIFFKKRVFKRLRFANRTIGEDANFLKRARSIGLKIYASSPFNFVGIRRKNKDHHTWKAPDSHVLRRSQVLARTDRYHKFAIRKHPN
jgi:glycosyltransferase involved in cell wall biosynthesis